MNTKTQNTGQAAPWNVKIMAMQFVCDKIASTVTLFTRYKQGMRQVSVPWTCGIAGFLMTFGWIFTAFSKRDLGGAFELYPVVLVATAFWKRRKRFAELCRGELLHTYSPGTSYLERLPLPAFLLNFRVLYRFVEPALTIILAMLTGEFISQPLGRWVFVAAICIFISEHAAYERLLDDHLTDMDLLIEADHRKMRMANLETGTQTAVSPTTEEVAEISSGVSSDLFKQIQKLRAKQQSS